MMWLAVGDEWHTRGWGRIFLAWLIFQANWVYWNIARPFSEWREIRAYRKDLGRHR